MNKNRLSFKALGHYNNPEMETQLAIFKFIMDLFMKFDIYDKGLSHDLKRSINNGNNNKGLVQNRNLK